MKQFLNQFHIWRFHFQLYDNLNDRFCFHYSYQPPGYWIPVNDPKVKDAFILDGELGLGSARGETPAHTKEDYFKEGDK